MFLFFLVMILLCIAFFGGVALGANEQAKVQAVEVKVKSVEQQAEAIAKKVKSKV